MAARLVYQLPRWDGIGGRPSYHRIHGCPDHGYLDLGLGLERAAGLQDVVYVGRRRTVDHAAVEMMSRRRRTMNAG